MFTNLVLEAHQIEYKSPQNMTLATAKGNNYANIYKFKKKKKHTHTHNSTKCDWVIHNVWGSHHIILYI